MLPATGSNSISRVKELRVYLRSQRSDITAANLKGIQTRGCLVQRHGGEQVGRRVGGRSLETERKGRTEEGVDRKDNVFR